MPTDAPADARDEDLSTLCRACGLCCDWSLFRRVTLAPHEVAWAAARRLPIVQGARDPTFELPCRLLEARGDERVCSDYAQRPATCRTFECKVRAAVRRADQSLDEALRLVRDARGLIDAVEARLGGEGAEALVARLSALPATFEASSAEVRALDAETLLDLGLLRSVVLPRFYDEPEPPG